MLVTTAVLVAAVGLYTKDAALYGVENYAACGQDNTTYPKDYALRVEQKLFYIGYQQIGRSEDGNVEAKDFVDASIQPWGADHLSWGGADWGDVTFFSGHSGHVCSGGVYRSELIMGSSDNWCVVDTRGDMLYADGGNNNEELNVLILLSCESSQLCVWQNDGYPHRADFNIINGFHGVAFDSSANIDRVGNYVVSAQTHGLGDDWVDMLTDFNWLSDDQCATSMVWGLDTTYTDSQYLWGGFNNFHYTGNWHPVTRYYYICGCDPRNGPALTC